MEIIPTKKWGCRAHWWRLPKVFRDQIIAAYAKAGDVRADPSEEYMKAEDAAREWAISQIRAGRAP